MRIIVTGSRHWSDRMAVWTALEEAVRDLPPEDDLTIVHGGCPTGADAIAAKWAPMYGATAEAFRADWSTGRRAGPIRNQRMVEAGADVVLAFPLPDGRGTQDCMRRARLAGIPVKVWGES